jgi:hypothetical protein
MVTLCWSILTCLLLITHSIVIVFGDNVREVILSEDRMTNSDDIETPSMIHGQFLSNTSHHNNRGLKVGHFLDYWHCGANPWETDYNESHAIESAAMIQEYLYAWQHNKYRCNPSKILHAGFDNGGIGSSYFMGLSWLAEALEKGKIHMFRDIPEIGIKDESFTPKYDEISVYGL